MTVKRLICAIAFTSATLTICSTVGDLRGAARLSLAGESSVNKSVSPAVMLAQGTHKPIGPTIMLTQGTHKPVGPDRIFA